MQRQHPWWQFGDRNDLWLVLGRLSWEGWRPGHSCGLSKPESVAWRPSWWRDFWLAFDTKLNNKTDGVKEKKLLELIAKGALLPQDSDEEGFAHLISRSQINALHELKTVNHFVSSKRNTWPSSNLTITCTIDPVVGSVIHSADSEISSVTEQKLPTFATDIVVKGSCHGKPTLPSYYIMANFAIIKTFDDCRKQHLK